MNCPRAESSLCACQFSYSFFHTLASTSSFRSSVTSLQSRFLWTDEGRVIDDVDLQRVLDRCETSTADDYSLYAIQDGLRALRQTGLAKRSEPSSDDRCVGCSAVERLLHIPSALRARSALIVATLSSCNISADPAVVAILQFGVSAYLHHSAQNSRRILLDPELRTSGTIAAVFSLASACALMNRRHEILKVPKASSRFRFAF